MNLVSFLKYKKKRRKFIKSEPLIKWTLYRSNS